MYIAHIVSCLTTGGAEKLVADMSVILKKNNRVKVISILDKRGVPYDILKKNGIEIVELNYTNRFDIRIAYDLYKETKECDIVHTHTFYAQFYSAILINKCKLITTEHSTNNKRRERGVFKVLDYLMYKKYKHIICISNATQLNLNRWIKSTKEKTKVISNGIDIESYVKAKPIDKHFFNIDNDNIILTCVASLTIQKNHISLIKAMKDVDKKVHLFLIGDGPLKEDLVKEVEELKLGDRIHFMGICENVKSILKGSDIFILTSIWEGFGLVAVEAAACNLPLILSDVSGLNSLFDKNKLYKVQPKDIDSISRKINLVSKNLNKELRKVSLEEAYIYDIKIMIQKYSYIYEDMLNNK